MSDEHGHIGCLLLFLYVFSLGLTFHIMRWFSVMDISTMSLAVCFCVPLYIVVRFLGEIRTVDKARVLVITAHILLAIIIYPGFYYEVHQRSPEPQFIRQQYKLLKQIHNTKSDRWYVIQDLSRDLAKSLEEETRFQLYFHSPYLYWLFPPSFVLIFWAIIIFFLPGSLVNGQKTDNNSDCEEDPIVFE